jgi:hypothetical protein
VYQARGDPFLGGLFRGIKSIGKVALGAIGIGGKVKVPSAAEIGAAVKAALPGVGAAVGAGVLSGGAAAITQDMMRAGASAGFRRSGRRMNPGNVKALRRSMRRVQSFAKLAKSTITFTRTVRMKKRGKR